MARTANKTSNEEVKKEEKKELLSFIPKINVICKYGTFFKGKEYQVTKEIKDKLIKLGA